MKSRYPELVKVLESNRLKLKCLICGHEWIPNGRLYKRNWFCPQGCTEKVLLERVNLKNKCT